MYKQVIIIRRELNMSKGKTAVQTAHASLGAFLLANKRAVRTWKQEGQKKVVVATTLSKILELHRRAESLGIANFLVQDAGLTELEPDTVTALGIGPDKEEKIDKLTGSLKLLD
jgi:PTH2 family peptidyl-tRNA hydrolase